MQVTEEKPTFQLDCVTSHVSDKSPNLLDSMLFRLAVLRGIGYISAPRFTVAHRKHAGTRGSSTCGRPRINHVLKERKTIGDVPLTDGLFGAQWPAARRPRYLVGVLKGEGIGPETLDVCLSILERLGELFDCQFEVRFGGPIGQESLQLSGRALSEEVVRFCREVFGKGGSILAGPGGGRFVYEMRREFDLFVKLNPVVSFAELNDVARLRLPSERPLSMVVVRDNQGGLYQGRSHWRSSGAGRRVTHTFEYAEQDVLRLLTIAARLAAKRRRHLTVVCKEGGLPELTRLWFECAEQVALAYEVELCRMDIDLAAYQFIARPEQFDVIAVPNCFGDILADLGGLIMASRGVTYGASYSPQGLGVYQTNHGAAYDLAGTDRANPVGQIFSLAMMLRESFGLRREADAIEKAVRAVWREGWRTEDVAASGHRVVGMREMGTRVAEKVEQMAHRCSPAGRLAA